MITARQEVMLRKTVAKLIEASIEHHNKGIYDPVDQLPIIEDEAEARAEFDMLLAELRIS